MLVAAHLGAHMHHSASVAALAGADTSNSSCAAHSLAETYFVLTRLPLRPRIAPEQAMLFIDDVRERLSVLTLDASAYIDTLREIADRSIAGGRIYDALLLRCAAQADAAAIYTWNVDQFRRLAPKLANRIQTP